MQNKKLTLEHLSAYLPYGLKMTKNGFIGVLKTACLDLSMQSGYRIKVSCSDWWENNILNENIYKPILRPLSDLTKKIEHNGKMFVPIEWLDENIKEPQIQSQCVSFNDGYVEMCYYLEYQKLFEWYFDVFGLINKGLAVSIHDVSA